MWRHEVTLRSTERLFYVQAKFSGKIKVIARPSDADTATVRGAAQYGLSRKTVVSTVIVPRAYIMKVSVVALRAWGAR